MSSLQLNNHAEPLDRNSKAAVAQVGWLGNTGAVYPWGTPLDEIHKHETGWYTALYVQIGEWEKDNKSNWHVEED
jgi:hypothetical protein